MKNNILIAIFAIIASIPAAKGQINIQERGMWCWAACIESALAQAQVYQSQTQIASRLTGYASDRPAQIQEVIAILNTYNFTAWSVAYPATPQQLYTTLSSGWKLIAFVNPTNNPAVGHFIMLQGVMPNGQIVVSDPANGMTYQQDVGQLYYAWNWSSSIVVGTP